MNEQLHFSGSTDAELRVLQEQLQVNLPADLAEYFLLINGTGGEYTKNMFEFYSINNFKNIKVYYEDWEGIPSYNKACSNLVGCENYFCFANSNFHSYAYAIYLSNELSESGKVYTICGEDYREISTSFNEFLALYMNDSEDLYL